MPSESEIIDGSAQPVSPSSLLRDLRELGLNEGAVVIVHSSLSALGWVAGGAQAVVEALLRAVGTAGTIVMPSQSGQLSDPADWTNPPVPDHWVAILRQELPAFDPYLTPTRAMGRVVECFRQHRGTLRSPHPTDSFAANGARSIEIVAEHPLTPSFGEASPLARLYDLDAVVLLLGVGHANNTSLHLGEHRATWVTKSTCRQGAPVLQDGHRVWVEYDDLDYDDSDFTRVGEAFGATGLEKTASVGVGLAKLCRQRALVDFSTQWFTENR